MVAVNGCGPRGPLPLILTGQSNALPDRLGAALVAAYAPGRVLVTAQGSTGIRAWDLGGPLWQRLAPTLRQPVAAVAWWQGETDAQQGNPHYEADARGLFARVRATTGNPRLLIVVVQILPYVPPPPLQDATLVRAAQAALVASDPNSVLLSVDDLPTDGGNHSVAYPEVAARIVSAVHARSLIRP